MSTWNNGHYVSLSGTSFACPHVTGVAALLLSHQPGLSANQLLTILKNSVRPLAASLFIQQGADTTIGIVDALAAIQLLNNKNLLSTSNTCVPCSLKIVTDQYGIETSYLLKRNDNQDVIWTGQNLSSNQTYMDNACLEPSLCYRFEIYDTYGDGIRGEGIELTYNGQILYKGGSFEHGGFTQFGDGC